MSGPAAPTEGGSSMGRCGRSGRTWTRSARASLVLVALATAASLLGSAAAAAQEDAVEPDDADPGGLVVFGELTDRAVGEVAGVRIEVRDASGVLGEAITGDDGAWSVPVPGPGTYEVELDATTLPDDVSLRNPDRAVLDNVRVLAGRDKRVNFALGEASGGARQLQTGNRLANLIWSGIVIGLVIALASIGLSLVFGATGLVNFAHGEMVTFGALVAWFFNSRSIGPTWSLFLAGVLAIGAAGAFGALQDRGLWRPLERRRLNLVSMMIVSIGLAMFLRYSYAVVFDSSPRPFRQFAAQAPWRWGPLVFPPKQLVVVVLALVVIVAYATTLQRTRLGTAVRAVSDNRDLAESSGIDVQRVVLFVWIVGSGLAGLGGVAYASLHGVQWSMGFTLLLPIFAAVVLGGLGTAYGPLVGGLAIGLVSELSTLWFPAEFKFAWGLGALIVVLIVRPQGILGRRDRIG